MLMRDNKKGKSSTPTDNQIYGVPANQFSPSEGTTLLFGGLFSASVDIFNSTSGTWYTMTLPGFLVATTVGDLALFGDGLFSASVDMFNSTSGTWSTASL